MKQRFKHIGTDECYVIDVSSIDRDLLPILENILESVSLKIDSSRRGVDLCLLSDDVGSLWIWGTKCGTNKLYWKGDVQHRPLCSHEHPISVHDFLNLLFTGELLEPVEPEKDQVDLDIELLKSKNMSVGVDLSNCRVHELYELLKVFDTLRFKYISHDALSDLKSLVHYSGSMEIWFYDLKFEKLHYRSSLPLPRYLAALRKMVEQHG